MFVNGAIINWFYKLAVSEYRVFDNSNVDVKKGVLRRKYISVL